MKLKDAVKDLLVFSGPIILGNLSHILISTGDVLIASKYSTLAVAAVGVASGFLIPIAVLGVGLTMGLSPAMSIRRGRGEPVEHYLFSSVVYSFLISILLVVALLGINQFMPYFGIEEELIAPIQTYLSIAAWSIPFGVVFNILKEYLQSLEIVMGPNIIYMIGVIINLGVNYILVFGMGPIPSLGIAGLAYATVFIRAFLLIAIVLLMRKRFGDYSIDKEFIKVMLKFSIPISFMIFLEVFAFSFVGILGGVIGVSDAAVNNIVMQLASLTFMVPLAISSAVGVKVGLNFGKKNFPELLSYIRAAFSISMFMMVLTALSFMIMPEALMKIFSADASVIKLGVSVLGVVGLFQLFDGWQVISSGSLRGLEETKFPSIIVFIGYWIIGVPLGAILAFHYDQGIFGLWLGLALALALIAIALGCFLKKRLKSLEFDWKTK